MVGEDSHVQVESMPPDMLRARLEEAALTRLLVGTERRMEVTYRQAMNKGPPMPMKTSEILSFPLDGNMRRTVIEETVRGLTLIKNQSHDKHI